MIRDVLSASGLELWAMIGLVIFVVVFILVVWRTWKMPRKKVDEYSNLPLEDDFSDKPKEFVDSDKENKDAGEK